MMKLTSEHGLKLARPFFESRNIQFDDSERSRRVFEIQQPRSHTLVEFLDKSTYFFEDVKEYDKKGRSETFEFNC